MEISYKYFRFFIKFLLTKISYVITCSYTSFYFMKKEEML